MKTFSINSTFGTLLEDNETVKAAASLSLQKRIREIQNPEDCSSAKLLHCGHSTSCGLGCQIHHRIVCLMVSYALEMPLVHDERHWPYSQPWGSVFKPLGSQCQLGKNNSFQMDFHELVVPQIYKTVADCPTCRNGVEEIKFPLPTPLVVPTSCVEKAIAFHNNPVQWCLAQFLDVGLRLTTEMKVKVENIKRNFNWTAPVVGFHVRRTDKHTETRDSVHQISEYFAEAQKIFDAKPVSLGAKNVFIATDDPSVFRNASNEYTLPTWHIMGSELLVKRKESLEETVVDIFLLAEASVTVCGYSSNICRLVLELMFIETPNAFERIRSLDSSYSYPLWGNV